VSLNEKQKAFCEYYASTFNATESAKKAGYSQKTARSIGQRLLTYVDVQKYLAELSNKAKTSRIADITEILEFFSETMRNKALMPKDRLKAAELLRESVGNAPSEEETVEEVIVSFEDASGDGADDSTS
jgi:phage terminase small subunit